MTRFFVTLSGVLFFYFCYNIYVAQFVIETVPLEIKKENPPGFYDYRGALNVQTDLSLGSAHPTHVIDEARKAGLDFLILTDVNQFEQAESFNGYHDNLLVMSESEYSFLDSRILVIQEQKHHDLQVGKEISLYLTDLLSQPESRSRSALAILAHPFSNGAPTWTGPYPPGLHGLEILNPKSLGSRAWNHSKLDVFWSILSYPFNSKYAFLRLFREPHEETSLWDKLAGERPFFAFAGADASSRAIPLANTLVRFPGYQKSLEIVSNHVLLSSELTGNFAKDRQKIFSAMRTGSFYSSVDLLGDPKGFVTTVKDREALRPQGSQIKFRPGLTLNARLGTVPKAFYEMVVIKDGQREATFNKPDFSYEIKGTGVYRVIVRMSPLFPLPDAKKWITWIYSNPFFLVDRLGSEN